MVATGALDGMAKDDAHNQTELPTKDGFLGCIGPGVKLDQDFFRRVYGYSYTDPAFAEQVMSALDAVGCDHARESYNAWVQSYEAKRNKVLRNVAEWYLRQDFYRKDVERPRIERETEQMKKISTKWMDGLF